METIVILHGWSLLADRAEDFVDELKKNYQIILPRLPGYGGSSETPKAQSMDWILDDLAQTFRENGLKRFHLLGFSMGAQIATHFARKYPEMVERLVLVGARPPEKQWRAAQLFASIPGLPLLVRYIPWLEYRIVDWAFAQAQQLTPGRKIEHFRPGDASLHGAYDTLIAQVRQYANPFKTKQPTLYAYGELDRMRPEDFPKEKQLEIVPGSGHNALMAGGKALAKTVASFLTA